MTARSIVVSQQRQVLQEIHSIVAEVDPEAAAVLTRYTPGNVIPNTVKMREEFDLFVLESLLILARAVRGKKRGRKPNVQWHDEESKAS
jgi:hypothetical protein